jgi:hypothetical protein
LLTRAHRVRIASVASTAGREGVPDAQPSMDLPMVPMDLPMVMVRGLDAAALSRAAGEVVAAIDCHP